MPLGHFAALVTKASLKALSRFMRGLGEKTPVEVKGSSSIVLKGRCGLTQRPWKLETKGKTMSLGTILIVLLVLALVGVLPTWGYSGSWGYAPGGIVGLLLVIIIILALLGRL